MNSVGGDFVVKSFERQPSVGRGLRSFLSFEGLNELTSIGGSLNILAEDSYGSLALESLTGFSKLEKIAGDLKIDESHRLSDINSLSSLKTVGGKISITSCSKLYDYCVLKPMLESFTNSFHTNYNGFDATQTGILNGYCSVNR